MIFLRPVDVRWPITQKYGENPDWYPSTNGHNGIDYGCPEDTPVRAAADGIVIRAELDTATAQNSKSGYGYHVRIQHKDNTVSIYGHFHEGGIAVCTGQQVKMGQIIGRSGNTGFSTGPHLHFEVRSGISLTACIDPTTWVVDVRPPDTGVFEACVLPGGDRLNVRTGPTKRNGIIKVLRAGEVFKVYGLTGSDIWLQTEDGYIKFDPSWVELQPVMVDIPTPEPPLDEDILGEPEEEPLTPQ